MNYILVLLSMLVSTMAFAKTEDKQTYLYMYKEKNYTCSIKDTPFSCLALKHKIAYKEIFNEYKSNKLPTTYYPNFKINNQDGSNFPCTKTRSVEKCLEEDHGIILALQKVGEFSGCSQWIKDTFPEDDLIELGSDGSIKQGGEAKIWNKLSKDHFLGSKTMTLKTDELISKSVKISSKIKRNRDGSLAFSRRIENLFNFQPQFDSHKAYFPPYKIPENSEFTPNTVEADFSIGEDGRCFPSNISFVDHDYQVKNVNTKRCYDILKFHKEHPELHKCTASAFKNLHEILGSPFKSEPKREALGIVYNFGSLTGKFESSLSLPQKVIIRASEEIKNCESLNVGHFAQDNALFETQFQGFRLPVSKKNTPALQN